MVSFTFSSSVFQEIPFRHIWSGNQNNLHCSFSLEMVDRVQDRISCKVQVYQKAILSNRQVLKINTNFKEVGNAMIKINTNFKEVGNAMIKINTKRWIFL